MQAEVTVGQGAVGGLVLFYSEKAYAGIVSNGNTFTIYETADRSETLSNPFGSHFFVKIVNDNNRCTLLASGDGKEWKTIRAGLDVSQMHHNSFGGFFALRPGWLQPARERLDSSVLNIVWSNRNEVVSGDVYEAS